MRGRAARPIMHATRPAAHRVDHTLSISAAPDDLRSRSGHAQLPRECTQSMFACIDQHVDQSMFHFVCFVVFESVCACMCVDCIDVCFESERLPAKKDFTRRKPVQLASETYDNTPHSPCSSISKLLEDHKRFFCQALRSRRSW